MIAVLIVSLLSFLASSASVKSDHVDQLRLLHSSLLLQRTAWLRSTLRRSSSYPGRDAWPQPVGSWRA